MSIFVTLKALIATLSATILTLIGIATPLPTPTPDLIPDPTPIIDQSAPIQQIESIITPTPTPDPIKEAYELGKSIGKIEGQIEVLEQIVTPVPTPELTPTPMPQPTETPIPSKAKLQVFGIYDPNALLKEYKVKTSADAEAGNYVQLGVIVFDDNGDPDKTASVTITATDESQNKSITGTGTFDKFRNAFYFPYTYEFNTAGPHTIRISANNLVEVIVLKAN